MLPVVTSGLWWPWMSYLWPCCPVTISPRALLSLVLWILWSITSCYVLLWSFCPNTVSPMALLSYHNKSFIMAPLFYVVQYVLWPHCPTTISPNYGPKGLLLYISPMDLLVCRNYIYSPTILLQSVLWPYCLTTIMVLLCYHSHGLVVLPQSVL